MDNNGELGSPLGVTHNEADKGPVDLNISDILDAICIADPAFDARSVAGMPRPAPALASAAAMPTAPSTATTAPAVRIVEQPASKALRFRYECEGRSAGSIPGVNSTSERKTYPTIEISGCTGNAIVVVSCVTKDHPYKPHPHNLVGRERCERGVCTVKAELSGDSTLVSFSNLGIQCVKRKDVDGALRTREELRVDPFKTGFSHRAQPQSIDLNAVRLCFQVFVTGERGKVRLALPPAVSDIIYDKKAMSDLHIARVSHCAGPAGGRMTMILLCEKVTGQDTAVVFFEKENDEVVWEAAATNVHVHKQAAIAFDIPPYRNPVPQDNVKVYLQLKRVTDNARSNAVDFEYTAPPGTARKPLPDLSIYSLLRTKPDTNNNRTNTHTLTELTHTDIDNKDLVSSTSDETAPMPDMNGDVVEIETNGIDVDVVDSNERSLDDLLDQVAELDEIYSENRTRLENVANLNDADNELEDFNDAGTYTSLQLAFKNPITITEPEPEPDPMSYEDVQVQTYRGPIIEFTPLKRDTEDERAPPLPPKRVRKTTEPFKTSQTSVDSILKPGKQLPITRNREKAVLSVAKSEPALPPAPKKRSFFSRLFRRKEKSPAPSVKSEGKKEPRSKMVGRSVSSVSGQRPSRFKSSISHTSLKDNASGAGLSYADSITHISLHGDPDEVSQNSLRKSGPIPPSDGTILVAESVLALDASAFKKLRDDLDLTDAEHYALYMAVAPHATASEFDETSCYYSPVDGSKFNIVNSKRKKPLSPFAQNINFNVDVGGQIKSEPRDSPGYMRSPPQHVYPPYEREPVQQWQIDIPQSMNMPGTSQVNQYHTQGMSWMDQNYLQPNQHLQPNSPNMQPLSPHMTHSPLGHAPLSPGMSHQQMGMGHPSPVMSHPSPVMGHMSPSMGHVSPAMGHVSPGMGHVSPGMGHMSPAMGHVSPGLNQAQGQYIQNIGQQSLIQDLDATSNSTPSISKLLEQGQGDEMRISADLSFPLCGADLSDSLRELSTKDLLNNPDWPPHGGG